MEILAEIRDKGGGIVKVISYEQSFKKQVKNLFREAYPDSFDKYDMEFIKEFLEEWGSTEDQRCFVTMMQGEMVGASLMEKVAGPQDQWETTYIFVRKSLQGRGIGRMLVGVQEEYLRSRARISFAINPGILPEDVISYPFWRTVGYELWGVLPGYFRDDLSGIFLVKRNPYYGIGRGIPKDSGWCPEMADSMTGRKISKQEYQKILRSLAPSPKAKWGLDLIGRENIVVWKS